MSYGVTVKGYLCKLWWNMESVAWMQLRANLSSPSFLEKEPSRGVVRRNIAVVENLDVGLPTRYETYAQRLNSLFDS